MNLKGIVSQRLLPKKDERGRVLAMELLYATPRIQALIRKQEFVDLKKAMRDVGDDKMVTLDKDLWRLYDQGLITEEIALSHADSVNNLRLRIKGFKAGSITTD
jgi:twitching motility protein PilU